jgi:hypothetical protein
MNENYDPEAVDHSLSQWSALCDAYAVIVPHWAEMCPEGELKDEELKNLREGWNEAIRERDRWLEIEENRQKGKWWRNE